MFALVLRGASEGSKLRVWQHLRRWQHAAELPQISEMWRRLPVTLGQCLPEALAITLAQELREAGAEVEVSPSPGPEVERARAWLRSEQGPAAAFGAGPEPAAVYRLLARGHFVGTVEVLVARWLDRVSCRTRTSLRSDPGAAGDLLSTVDTRAWEAIDAAAIACRFWEPLLPGHRIGADGITYRVWAQRPEQLQYRERWSPRHEPFGLLCDALLALCPEEAHLPTSIFCGRADAPHPEGGHA